MSVYLRYTDNAAKKRPMKNRAVQSVEKVQFTLGFFAFLWYNRNGDKNDSKAARKPQSSRSVQHIGIRTVRPFWTNVNKVDKKK